MPEVLLTGTIPRVSLTGVLQLIEGEALSGTLRLDAGGVDFSVGVPVGATCGRLRGTTALLEHFLYVGGRFSFEEGDVAGTSLGSLLGLIMEGCRLADEWTQLDGLVLLASEGAPADGIAGEIVRALDGSRTVDDAVRRLGVARVLAVDPIRQLLELGTLFEVTRPPTDRREIAPPTVGYARAMEEGRSRLREGDFDGAESSFELALTLRPDDVIARQNLRRVRTVRAGDGHGYQQWLRRR